MPCLMLQAGQVMLPGASGPQPAKTPDGQLFDVLDVSDQLAERFGRIYVVDLDGLEHDQPQLDYLQEISRAAEIWVDAGVRTADQAIDIVVAGAFRTVLSSAVLERSGELEQAWKLSPEIAFEVEVRGGRAVSKPTEWSGLAIPELAAAARGVGVRDVVYSPRAEGIDWHAVRSLSSGGPVWVAGSFDTDQLPELTEAGAAGGIFHITEELTSIPVTHERST
ncbi:MAG: HisA/HisF-related TIM barrel protein [Thermoplasmata archaeon]|nr:HisA/HisF-related TIM barrel protein [Thermoplasmata archaeon]